MNEKKIWLNSYSNMIKLIEEELLLINEKNKWSIDESKYEEGAVHIVERTKDLEYYTNLVTLVANFDSNFESFVVYKTSFWCLHKSH